MSFSTEDVAAVKAQLKEMIVSGKITCFKCHFPVDGVNIQQIDMVQSRVLYKCGNDRCDNHDRAGYRSFRALGITIPSMKPDTDFAAIKAPAPPQPEQVQWSGDGEELQEAEFEGEDANAPETPAPTPETPVEKPAPVDPMNDPNREG